ncbi:MAG: hypothetical protein SNJ29_16630 [Rikenellaceae bacterium]
MPYHRVGRLRRSGFSLLGWGEIGKPCTAGVTAGLGLNISTRLSSLPLR